ncbi:MAG: hypothetical protein MJE77_06740 [Proteobacteria bacterium]|nr:hypothetical protein [Pseudomonadota bacterium]
MRWIRSLSGIEYRFGEGPIDCGRRLISGKRPVNRGRSPLATRCLNERQRGQPARMDIVADILEESVSELPETLASAASTADRANTLRLYLT